MQRDALRRGTLGNLEEHRGYGEKENVRESSQVLAHYLPHNTASKQISSALHYQTPLIWKRKQLMPKPTSVTSLNIILQTTGV